MRQLERDVEKIKKLLTIPAPAPQYPLIFYFDPADSDDTIHTLNELALNDCGGGHAHLWLPRKVEPGAAETSCEGSR